MPTAPPVHRPHGKRKRAGAPRQNSTQRGYGSRWQRARDAYLRRYPLCAHCESAGRVVAATDVDHVIPHRGDETLFWRESNWQPLCKPCHSRKTASGA